MFIYKTIHTNGRYYIGRCSRKHSDSYLGSGRWVKSIKDKTQLTRVILSEHSSFEELCEAEERAIREHIDDPLCMNYNDKSVGFATGDLNPSRLNNKRVGMKHSQATKEKIRDIKKQQYADGLIPNTKAATEASIERSREVNSRTYEISFPNGEKKIITNMKRFCEENGYSDIVFHRRHVEGKPYRGMFYIKL